MPPKKKTPARKPCATSTGRVKNVEADQTTWRVKLQQSRLKFDDVQKRVYLDKLAEFGLKGTAAKAAGVSGNTVRNHRDNDPEFAEAEAEAIDAWHDIVSREIGHRAVVGVFKAIYYKGVRVVEPILDDDGVPLTTKDGEPRYRYVEERVVSDRLIELEGKRVEPTYRDKTTIDIGGTGGGVLFAPAGISPEDEIAQAAAVNEKSREDHKARMAEASEAKKKVGGPAS